MLVPRIDYLGLQPLNKKQKSNTMSSLRKKLKETERLRKEAEDEAKDPYEKAFENVINKAKRGKL